MSIKKGTEDNLGNKPKGDKRAEPRVPVPMIPVRVGDGPESLPCVMLNLSRSGALIQSPRLLEEQSVINTDFFLPTTETPVNCHSRVIWSRSVYDIHTRLGIKFDDMDPAASEKVGYYVHDQIIPQPGHRKRAEQRVPAPYISVLIADGYGYSKGVILDISRTGLLIQTAKNIHTGTVISAEFILPGTGKVIKCLARAAWRKSLYETLVNVGFEFIDIDDGGLEVIDGFIGKQTLSQA